MNSHSVHPKKSLGQHFLRDKNILRKIVHALELQAGDVVLEIGPGDGALTRLLAEQPVTLLAVEIDQRVVPLLQREFGDRLQLYHTDIRSINFHELYQEHRKHLRVVGNIPYYLTSDILFHLFHYHEVLADATLMMQREVAQRIVAVPNSKTYGILSVVAHFYSTPTLLFHVSRHVFYPKPAVDSAVVRFVFNHTLPQVDETLFLNLVKATFGKRRKTLRNSLQYFGLSDNILTSLPLDLSRRPESLSLGEFLQLTQYVSRYYQENS